MGEEREEGEETQEGEQEREGSMEGERRRGLMDGERGWKGQRWRCKKRRGNKER